MVGLMHQREATFAVNASPDELWRFIRDFESLCTCIPGVERIQRIDDRTAELTVKEKIGVVPLSVDLKANICSEDPPHRLHAVASAEHLTMEIDVALRAAGSGTELVALFKVAGQGQLKPIVDRLFERRASERTVQFAECLARRFGADGSSEVRSGAPQALARGGTGSLRRWFGALWRRLLGKPTLPGK